MTLNSLLSSIDFIGVTPQLYHNERMNHKSLFGGIISIIISISILSFSFYFFYVLISKNSFTIYENNIKNPSSTKQWGDDFSIIVLDKYLNILDNANRLFDISASIFTDQRIKLNNGSVISNTVMNDVNVSECQISNWTNFLLWRDEKLINSSTCFSPNNQNLNSTGVFGATGYTGIVFWIHFCANDTSINKTDCFSIEEIKETLDNVFVYVKFLNYYFDHNVYRNYVFPYVYSELLQGSSSVYKRQWYEFQNHNYISDNGLIFTMAKSTNVTVLASGYNSIDLRMHTTVNNTFFAVSLNMLDTEHQIHRSYYKVQNLLADCGGILKAILIIGQSLTFIQSNLLYFQEVIDCDANYRLLQNDYERRSRFLYKFKLPSLQPKNDHKNLNMHSQGDILANSNSNSNMFGGNSAMNLKITNHHYSKNQIENKNVLYPKKTQLIGRNTTTRIPVKISLSFKDVINPMLFFAPRKYCHHSDMSVRVFSRLLAIMMRQLSVTQIINSINRFERAERVLLDKKPMHSKSFLNFNSNKEEVDDLKALDLVLNEALYKRQ